MGHVYNVCVVGAGIIGSSAAYNAAKQTNDVILCEQVNVENIYIPGGP